MVTTERPLALHVLTRLILGGPTRPVLAGLEGLRRRGYQPLLACGPPGPGEEEADAPLSRFPDVPVLRLPTLQRRPAPLDDLRCLGRLRETARRLVPSVIHTHTAKAGTLGRLAAWAAPRVPARVHTFHGHSLSAAASGRARHLYRLIERWLAGSATDLLLTVSPSQKAELARLLGPRAAAKLRVQPLCFDPAAYGSGRRAAPDPARASAGGRRLAFVGRGVPLKGLDLLARAHARLAARDPLAAEVLEVIVVGPVEQEVRATADRTLASAGLSRRWCWAGPRQEPLRELRGCDGLALPSRSEGTPVSVLEALWLGLPVLAAEVGGVGELIAAEWRRLGPGRWRCSPAAPRGLLLPADDVERWAAALADFVRDPAALPGDPAERSRFVETTFAPAALSDDLDRLYAEAGAVTPRHERPAESPARAARQPGAADQPRHPAV